MIPGSFPVLLAPASGGYVIEGSGAFDGDSGYLYRAQGQTSNQRTFTYNIVAKGIGSSTTLRNLLLAYEPGNFQNDERYFNFYVTNEIVLELWGGEKLNTTQVFRDPSAYYDILLAIDTTQSTASNRVKLYVNGTQITAFDTASYPSQNAIYAVNNTDSNLNIGARVGVNNDGYWYGNIARACLIDGLQLTPTSFGETSEDGFWQLNDISELTFGANGFVIEGSAMAAGTDSSGNTNNFTKVATVTTSSDSPTNSDDGFGNYATLNPLLVINSGAMTRTLSNGNLRSVGSGSNGTTHEFSSLTPSTGKWHFEVTITNIVETVGLGINTTEKIISGGSADWYYGGIVQYAAAGVDGKVYNNGSNVATNTAASAADGHILKCEVDLDNGSIEWFNNANASVGTYSFTPSGNYVMGWTMNDSGCDGTINYGASAFDMTPSSGFKALSTANLPEPAIINPDDHFFSEVVTHNGTSTAATCTFNLDTYEWLAIIKNTTGAVEKWYWIDSLNGVNKYWSSNANTAISSDANVLSVSGTQFSLGSSLGAKKYLVEFHRAGLASATAANTAGSLHSTKTSFNTESGFEIHLYEGTGANATLGNPLSKALDFMIAKRLDGTDRALAWHKDLDTPTTGYLDLATTAPEANHASIWNSTIPTATLISLGTNSNVNNAGTQVLFGWHSVDSYSLFWRHEGTANASGPFINTGSYPNVILTKDIDTAADSWYYFNEALSAPNQWGYPLLLQATNVPVDNSALDAVSNGIKLRSTNSPNVASSYVGAMWGGRPIQGDGKINQGRAR